MADKPAIGFCGLGAMGFGMATHLVKSGHRVKGFDLYAPSLARFEALLREHPQSAMAMDYVLTVAIFRELYHQDLLDTTYYAHDNFLTSKRAVDVPASTRQRIEDDIHTPAIGGRQQLRLEAQIPGARDMPRIS